MCSAGSLSSPGLSIAPLVMRPGHGGVSHIRASKASSLPLFIRLLRDCVEAFGGVLRDRVAVPDRNHFWLELRHAAE